MIRLAISMSFVQVLKTLTPTSLFKHLGSYDNMGRDPFSSSSIEDEKTGARFTVWLILS